MAETTDWANLGFQYIDTGKYVTAEFHDGAWGPIKERTDATMNMHIAAACLHYGQACFEGLKAFNRKDGSVAVFRPEANCSRMASSAERLVMEAVPEELFLDAVKIAVNANREFVPPYGTGASLYIRPLLLGTTPRVGVRPSDDYLFIVLVMPVGPYYKDGFFPVDACIQEDYDRAAPKGVGHVKAAGNYAAGLRGDMDSKAKGFPISLYLDSATHTQIDEFGTSNFFGITKDGKYITPNSSSVLPSITNMSLQTIAGDFGFAVEQRPVPVTELASLVEVGACGTAAVITPVRSITRGSKKYTFGSEDKAGETLTKLFDEIQSIQYGDVEDRHNWMMSV